MDYDERIGAVARCENALDGLDVFLRGPGAATRPAWQDLGHPVVAHERNAIVPLAVLDAHAGDALRGDFALFERELRDLWVFRFGGHDRRVGAFRDDDDWGRRVIARKLADAGVQESFWWEINNHVVIYALAAASLALHVVPREWILEGNRITPTTERALARARRVQRRAESATLRWDADAVVDQSGGVWVTTARQ